METISSYMESSCSNENVRKKSENKKNKNAKLLETEKDVKVFNDNLTFRGKFETTMLNSFFTF